MPEDEIEHIMVSSLVTQWLVSEVKFYLITPKILTLREATNW